MRETGSEKEGEWEREGREGVCACVRDTEETTDRVSVRERERERERLREIEREREVRIYVFYSYVFARATHIHGYTHTSRTHYRPTLCARPTVAHVYIRDYACIYSGLCGVPRMQKVSCMYTHVYT